MSTSGGLIIEGARRTFFDFLSPGTALAGAGCENEGTRASHSPIGHDSSGTRNPESQAHGTQTYGAGTRQQLWGCPKKPSKYPENLRELKQRKREASQPLPAKRHLTRRRAFDEDA